MEITKIDYYNIHKGDGVVLSVLVLNSTTNEINVQLLLLDKFNLGPIYRNPRKFSAQETIRSLNPLYSTGNTESENFLIMIQLAHRLIMNGEVDHVFIVDEYGPDKDTLTLDEAFPNVYKAEDAFHSTYIKEVKNRFKKFDENTKGRFVKYLIKDSFKEIWGEYNEKNNKRNCITYS